jgi:hypothetical protein
MSHDKIKAAARRRMAATGEPYAAARREAITEHGAAVVISAVGADDVRAAAAAHQELGPEYSDAVVASFIEMVDKAVAARVEARLANRGQSRPAAVTGRGRRFLRRRVARDLVAASAGALVAAGAVGLYAITSSHPGLPPPKVAAGTCGTATRNRGSCVLVPRPHSVLVRMSRVNGHLTITAITVAGTGQGPAHR